MNEKIIDGLEIRALSTADDLKTVADLIYASDDYIYPYWFDNDISTAEKVLANMMLGDTIYNYKNIRVALSDGQIIAMIVTKSVPIKANYEQMINCCINAAVPVGERFARVYNEYFKPLEDEPPDVYIANLAVAKMFRGAGVGATLMRSVFDDGKTFHLEVVKSNQTAVNLYKKLGFEIDLEYPGFTGIPCYKMTKLAKGEK